MPRHSAKAHRPEGREGQVRTRREVTNGPCDDDLSLGRLAERASGDVEADPTEIVGAKLDLTRVDRGADVDSQAGEGAP